MRISGNTCRFLLSIVICALLLAGCTYTVVPGAVPLVREQEGVSLSGVSVLVRSAEKEGKETPVLTPAGDRTGFRADRQAWSRKLVESLARELARRGAQVRANAPATIEISLPAITFTPSREQYLLNSVARVSLSNGWTRDYTGTASVPVSSVASSRAVDRLAGQALAEAVRAMLADNDFLTEIRK